MWFCISVYSVQLQQKKNKFAFFNRTEQFTQNPAKVTSLLSVFNKPGVAGAVL